MYDSFFIQTQEFDIDRKTLYKLVHYNGTIIYQNIACIWHRIGGPAVVGPDGTKEYWVDGKRHRSDGPAIILPDGTQEYWVDDIQYDEEQYPQAVFNYNLKQMIG